jgi:hypothetical protein
MVKLPLIVAALLLAAAAGALWWQLRSRGVDRWLARYALDRPKRRAPRRGEPVHLLLCIADHYEPGNGGVTPAEAQQRVERWVAEYPKLFERFRDADGHPPRHSFFYPLEQYVPEHLEALAGLCRDGFGEVEVHLHHDGDTADGMRARLLEYRQLLARRHGLLARRRDTGEVTYAFIHGDWALDNSRPDGGCCGVNNELDVLRETGCYVDMTMPSAPDPTQTRKLNSIYYAIDDPHRSKSHDTGVDAGAAPRPDRALLMIQGPLVLNWRSRKWGVAPRLENGNIQGSQPATIERVNSWLRARVQVAKRPDWFFVKLHTHGAPEENQAVLLGEPMVRFHEALARRAREDGSFRFHYVTAREMYNLARAAEDGWSGSVADARDYELVWPGEPARPVPRNSASFAMAARMAHGQQV